MLLFAYGAASHPKPPDPIDTVGQRYHDAGTFDGVIAVRRQGQPLYLHAFGDARVDQVFPYASVTKQVAALLVMQEVEAKRISLDAPIGTYLPGTSSAITVKQLLQHTSGIGDPEAGTAEDQLPAFYLRPRIGTAREEADGCLALAPGEAGAFHYNNCDYIVIGAILEHVTGTSFAGLVHARIATKLGLRSWGVFGVDPAPVSRARGHGDRGELAPDVNFATFGAAGALFGNATDLSTFAQALLDGRLLGPDASAQLFAGDRTLQMEALGSWQYELVSGAHKIDLVERQGDIAGVRALSLFSRSDQFTITVLASTERAPLFELWAKRGMAFDLVMAVVDHRG